MMVCEVCGKYHRADRCPKVVNYHLAVNYPVKPRMQKGQRAATNASASNRRLERAFREMRNG